MGNILEEISEVRKELYKLPLRIDVSLDRNAAKTIKEAEEKLRHVVRRNSAVLQRQDLIH